MENMEDMEDMEDMDTLLLPLSMAQLIQMQAHPDLKVRYVLVLLFHI